MVADKLQILIFTYNRAASLERTLSAFCRSPFSECAMTALDNHSTDHTPAVCESFEKQLPSFNYIRHPKNIGGLANYLRAVELSSAKYTWIICDDDTFDFTNAKEIIAAIDEDKYDLISVGVEGHELPGGYSGSLRHLALNHPYFYRHSFVPSSVFRTALFGPEILRMGYDNIVTMFPHFPFMAHLAEADARVYVTRNKIIQKSNNVGYSTFRFLTGWAMSCRKISDKELRRKAISEVFGRSVFTNLVYSVLTERQFRPNQYQREYRELLIQCFALGFAPWLKALTVLPLVAAPKFLHSFFWSRYSDYRKRRSAELPNFDEDR